MRSARTMLADLADCRHVPAVAAAHDALATALARGPADAVRDAMERAAAVLETHAIHAELDRAMG